MEHKVTFASLIKEELISDVDLSLERLQALLSAYIRINGVLSYSNKKTIVILKTGNAKIAKFLYSSIKKIKEDVDIKLDFVRKNNRKKTFYHVIINDADSLLDLLSVSFLEGKIPKDVVYNDETISGYLAGAFLATGSINSPRTSNYHLEITTVSENYAHWLAKLFPKYKKIEMSPKITTRRDRYVIYFKKSDQISNFLIMIGAVSSCLEFEDVRANRDLMNNANRLTNMDTANMKKTYENAIRQIEEINLIDKRLGIENLTTLKMRTLCKLRLENEGASLQELSVLLSEAIGKPVSKSNVNHLFISLHQVYEKLNYDD